MEIFNIHDAKKHPSRLIERAVRGEPSIVVKAGRRMVRVIVIDMSLPAKVCRERLLEGQIRLTDDPPKGAERR